MKIPLGLLTPSFGQLVDVLAAIEHRYILSKQNNHSLRPHAVFSFPTKSEFNLIAEALKKVMFVSENSLIERFYYGISRILGPEKVLSMSDFIDDAYAFYNSNEDPRLIDFVLERNSNKLIELRQALYEKQIDLSRLILVYSRDSFYDSTHSENFSPGITERNAFRNGSTENLAAVINTLLSLNFSVVKIGRSNVSLEKGFSSRNGFFDYSTCELVSDYCDFFLWSEAVGAVSTGGGANHPAFLFKTPLLLIDFAESMKIYSKIHQTPISYLPKIYVDSNSGDPICQTRLREMGFFESTWHLPGFPGIEQINNPSNAIRASVLDFFSTQSVGAYRGFVNLQGIQVHSKWANLCI